MNSQSVLTSCFIIFIQSLVLASIKESLIHKDRNYSTQRPKTTSTVARRMVGHALGIKINVSPEQRQKEHTQIQLAKGKCCHLLL